MIKIIFYVIFIYFIFIVKSVYAQEIKVYGQDQKIVKFKGYYFIHNLEIFDLKDNGEFGDRYNYKVDREKNLVDVAYNLKVGYYELRMANPFIQPFNLKKGDSIVVDLKNKLPPNFEFWKIYVDIYKKRLFLPVVDEDGKKYVITFPVGTGDDEYPTPTGIFNITEKKINPDWVVPPSAKKNKPELPPIVPYGSPDNGLGTRALRLNGSSYMIHGTNKKSEKGVGMNISYGCVAMKNEDIERIFDIVEIGTQVIIFDSSKLEQTLP